MRPRRDGQTLVETLVGLTVLLVGMMGIVSLLVRSLGLSRFVADNYTAAYLAAEGIELIKSLIDHNVQSGAPWNNGFPLAVTRDFEVDYATDSTNPPDPNAMTLYSSPGRKLRVDSATGLYGYASGESTGFARKVSITFFNNPPRLNVKSIVAWNSPFGRQQVDLEDEFYEP